MSSFAFPLSGNIQSVTGTAQGSVCVISTGQVVTANGVSGGDRSVITALGIVSQQQNFQVDFPIDQGQLVFIDVKTAGTFVFTVKV